MSLRPNQRRGIAVAGLALLVALVVGVALRRSDRVLGWPDEWIYLTLARNIAERGSLDTNFYIASSIEAVGYPHRDVHLPGYALALAAFGSLGGYTIDAAILLNVVSFVVSLASVFLIARRFLTFERSVLACALTAILPPYPGYLSIAYPEHATAAATLALAVVAAWFQGRAVALALGFALGLSLLFRETALFLLPLIASLVGFGKAARYVLPGFLVAIVTVLPPLSKNRAVHPNALYPSAVTEALSQPNPVSSLAGTILSNAKTNLSLLFSSNPFERAEDAVLLFLICLFILGALAGLRSGSDTARLIRGAALSTVALFAAMVAIYVVRERGGVWGGVRALMPMAPFFIIGLCGLSLRRRDALALTIAGAATFLYLDSWQIRFFNRYKAVNLEDQDRAATFIEERTRRFAPRRVVGGRYFQYAYRNFPVEIVWSGADDIGSINRLYPKFPFDMVVIHRRSPMRFDLRKDPRYEWVNADEGQGAEYQIYRRVEP
jgi:hypothetical protein